MTGNASVAAFHAVGNTSHLALLSSRTSGKTLHEVSMGTLLQLANELICQIMNNLVPDGIEALSQVSKPLYNLCEKHLQQHRNHKRRYTTITFSRNQRRGGLMDWHGHPLALLRALLLTPTIALYPRKVVFGYWVPDTPEYAPDYPAESERRREYCAEVSKEVGRGISTAVTRCHYIPRDKVEQWIKNIKSGDFHMTLFLLFTLLVNVEEIQGLHQFFAMPVFRDMLDVVAKAVDEPLFDHPKDQAFGNLTKISLSEEWHMNDIEVDLLIQFSALPSVRTLEAYDVIQARAENPKAYPSHQSGVTAIKIMRSNISPELFSSLLEHTPNLNGFTYQHHISTHIWKPIEINLALQKYTLDSLEHLDMTGWRENRLTEISCPVGSLRRFPNLKWIRLEAGMLRYNNRSGEPQRLVDMLPASTEHLVLVGNMEAERTVKAFDGLVEMKNERLLGLDKIWFEACRCCSSHSCSYLQTKDTCNDAGTASSITGHGVICWRSRRGYEKCDFGLDACRQMVACPLNGDASTLPPLRM